MVRLLLESGASAEARNKAKQLPISCGQNSNVIAIFTQYALNTQSNILRKQSDGSKSNVSKYRGTRNTCSGNRQ